MNKRDLPAVTLQRGDLLSACSQRALKAWNPGVRNVSGEGQGENSISILDVIGEDFWGEGVTARRVAAALRPMAGKPVTVNINSPGGDYFEGLAIYNALREHDAPVTVKILGMAASAASVIAMAGDTVQIARAAFLMIHNTWVVAAGDRLALRETADWLEPFDQAAVDIYSARTGMEAKDVAKMLDKETWIGGAKAIDQGFADELLPADAVGADPKNAAKNEALRADRTVANIGRLAGVPRTEIRELIQALKAMPGAGPTDDKPGAVEVPALSSLLDDLRRLSA